MCVQREKNMECSGTLYYFYFVILSNVYILFDVDFTGIQQKGWVK